MRVSGDEYLRVSHLMHVSRVAPPPALGSVTTAPARKTSGAQVEFSAEAQEVQRVVSIVAQEPDVREDVVAALRERINSGNYHVTGEQIGEMMVRRFLADRVD